MRTVYCPESHVELARASAGVPYGHVPGHQYRDVDVIVTRRGDDRYQSDDYYRCQVVESWGSAQGTDEEHGRREAVARGPSVRAACDAARSRARAAGITTEDLESAMSRAEDEAEECG